MQAGVANAAPRSAWKGGIPIGRRDGSIAEALLAALGRHPEYGVFAKDVGESI